MSAELPRTTWDSLFGSDWSDQLEHASAQQRYWLNSEGSLTAKVRAVCRQGFNVRLLHQQLVFATESAARALSIAESDSLLHREVLLCDGDIPLVFACSLLPEVALSGRFEPLRQLDDQPLGQWIFAEPALQRTVVRQVQLAFDDNLFVRCRCMGFENDGQVCGRRSLFVGADAPLLVSEFFSTELLQRA